MSSIKDFLKNNLNFLIISFLTIFFFSFTTWDSDKDVINPDAINWHARSYFFEKALTIGDYQSTYQVYHPGITLMWLMSQTVYKDGVFYNKENFLDKDYLAKQVIYTVLTINFFFILLLLSKFLKSETLLLFGIIFTLEPFWLGVRRLVHLEALMVSFFFLSFLILLFYTLKSQKIIYLILSSLCFVLSFYTKSSAIIGLPVLFLIFIFGKENPKNKFKNILLILVSLILFLYILFPALWMKPIQRFPEMFTKIYTGATLIGYEGRMEVGKSGEGENLVLKKARTKKNEFYFNSLLYTNSPILWVFVFSTIPLVLYLIISWYLKNKGNFRFINTLKYLYSLDNFRISVFAVLGFLVFYIAYSLSTKSFERYSVVMFPFILLFISTIYNFLNSKIIYLTSILYLIFIYKDLKNIHPYYYAYGNSYLGGTYARYEVLNSPPFGVATLELSQKLSEYIKNTNSEYFPVIAGYKSLKAFFKDARNERNPFCDVDYFIQYFDDLTPSEACIGRSYKYLFSIKVAGNDYWKVYKFNRMSTRAKKLNEINLDQQNIVTPDAQNNNQ